MKILVSVNPEIPVPPSHYGGIERIADSLVSAYHQAGHRVILLAHPASTATHADELIGWKGAISQGFKNIYQNTRQFAQVWKAHRPDVVHNFSRILFTLPVLSHEKFRMVQSYQLEISPKNIRLAASLGGQRVRFTACASHMYQALPNRARWQTIHNFTDTDYFQDDEAVEKSYLFFLGRLVEIKGVREAIRVALDTHTPLKIAGNIMPGHEAYFEQHIRPYLTHPLIEYVGTVNDEQKRYHLQRAKALLFPILWDEPFGIVMAESMACGTPVVGFGRGSVPEVVAHQQTGFCVRDVEEMKAAVGQLDTLDRRRVRRAAEERFSKRAISEQYLRLLAQS